MSKLTRILFALPGVVAGIVVAWLVLAEHQIVPGPQGLIMHLQAVTCPPSVQNTGI